MTNMFFGGLVTKSMFWCDWTYSLNWVMQQGYRCGAWVFSPSIYPSLHFAFQCLTNGFVVCVCFRVRVYMYVWELILACICSCVCSLEYASVCVSLQPEERNGPQQQTTTHTVADLSEVIISNSKQTTSHYHADAASVQMWGPLSTKHN